MNVSALMNDGPEHGKEKKPSPEIHRSYRYPPPPPPPPLVTDAQPPTPSSYGPISHQQTPLYPPPPTGGARLLQGQGLTPLQTPPQAPGGVQYPFPSQTAQSPVGVHPGQQYRAYEVYAASTPGGRPSSHGYQFPQPTPAQHHPPGVPQGMYAYPNSSLSPTPSSHHSQTPHSVRQSPLSAMSYPPSQQHPQHQHQHSQPSTPLGPPPLYHQRSSHHADIHSPFHQRTLSSTSNGLMSGSPVQHHPSIGNLVESPNAYNRPSPHLRRTSDYLSQVERERSVSVSPKTKVPPRPPSFGSRNSSQQETYSSRSSVQTNVAHLAGSPTHVTHTPSHALAQRDPQPFGQFPNIAGEVSQTTPPSLQPPNSAFVAPGSSLLQASNRTTPPTQGIQHQSQKMGMNHLITPASEVPPSANGTSRSGPEAVMPPKQKEAVNIFIKQKKSPAPKKPAASPTPPVEQQQMKAEDDVPPTQTPSQPHLERQISPAAAAVKQEPLAEATAPAVESKSSRKRPAESELATEPPTKQRRTARKYTQPPIWARRSRFNPRFHQQEQQNGTTQPAHNNQQHHATVQPSGPSSQQPNGHPDEAAFDGRPPWLQNPPLDFDLIHSQQVLGKWEKTFKWNTPYPDMLRVVQDWLFLELDKLGDVGANPREGTIEIEAKIGTLLQGGSDERCNLPVACATVLRPEANDRYHFESRMNEVSLIESFTDSGEIISNFERSVAGRAQSHERIHERHNQRLVPERPHPTIICASPRNGLIPQVVRRRLRCSARLHQETPAIRSRTPHPHHEGLERR